MHFEDYLFGAIPKVAGIQYGYAALRSSWMKGVAYQANTNYLKCAQNTPGCPIFHLCGLRILVKFLICVVLWQCCVLGIITWGKHFEGVGERQCCLFYHVNIKLQTMSETVSSSGEGSNLSARQHPPKSAWASFTKPVSGYCQLAFILKQQSITLV